MPVHPCADGLTRDCFKAYPKWASQAFAYKLLHVLLPKQLTKNLPRILSTALIAPGVQLPPGVELPPGTIVSPDVSFPPGWTPEDPTPPGVIIPPEVSPTPPDAGATPPLYVEPWEPGPISGPGAIITPPFDIGELLWEQIYGAYGVKPWNIYYPGDIAMIIDNPLHAEIHAVDLPFGKYGNPTDNVHLEIWRTNYLGPPLTLVTGGTSTLKSGNSLPPFSPSQEWVRFLFPQKPIILGYWHCVLVAAHSGMFNFSDHYDVAFRAAGTRPVYYKLIGDAWEGDSRGVPCSMGYGISLM